MSCSSAESSADELSDRSSENKRGSFSALISRLRATLGKSGIGADEVGAQQLCDIMSDYQSDSADWLPLISQWPGADQPYVRNLVDQGNGEYNLLILVWNANSASRIHDHTKHCCMKMLQGTLVETLYNWPDERLLASGEAAPPTEQRVKVLNNDSVAYISNSIGLHSIRNPHQTEFAFSLHLYTPPVKICRVFDNDTGASSQCRM